MGGAGKAVAALAVAALIGAGVAATTTARAAGVTVSCAYVEAGAPGPAGNQLQVAQSEVGHVEVATSGSSIQVLDLGASTQGTLVACSGPASPSTTNIDEIVVQMAGDGAQSNALGIDLAGGPLAPGHSPESDGDSELEVTATTAGFTDVVITGQPGSDRFVFAGTNRNFTMVADLNAQQAVSEPDLFIENPGTLEVLGGGGDDTLHVLGTGPFTHTELRGQTGNDLITANAADSSGGPGRDLIRGGSFNEWLNGGGGDDRIVSRGGADRVNPGAGRDVVIAGPGGDRVKAKDRDRDRISCGGGPDSLRADPRDRAAGCEDVIRSRR